MPDVDGLVNEAMRDGVEGVEMVRDIGVIVEDLGLPRRLDERVHQPHRVRRVDVVVHLAVDEQ